MSVKVHTELTLKGLSETLKKVCFDKGTFCDMSGARGDELMSLDLLKRFLGDVL